jgi:hypothetical protein
MRGAGTGVRSAAALYRAGHPRRAGIRGRPSPPGEEGAGRSRSRGGRNRGGKPAGIAGTHRRRRRKGRGPVQSDPRRGADLHRRLKAPRRERAAEGEAVAGGDAMGVQREFGPQIRSRLGLRCIAATL